MVSFKLKLCNLAFRTGGRLGKDPFFSGSLKSDRFVWSALPANLCFITSRIHSHSSGANVWRAAPETRPNLAKISRLTGRCSDGITICLIVCPSQGDVPVCYRDVPSTVSLRSVAQFCITHALHSHTFSGTKFVQIACRNELLSLTETQSYWNSSRPISSSMYR